MHCVRRKADNSKPSKSVSRLFKSFKGFLSTKKAFRESNPTPLPAFKRWFNRQWYHLLTVFWYASSLLFHLFKKLLPNVLITALNWTYFYDVITKNGFYGNQKDENNIKDNIRRQKTLINERDMKYDCRKESFESSRVEMTKSRGG
jgi:hypothetical protein